MPKCEILKKFKIDPNYNEKDALLKEIEVAKDYLYKELEVIDKIEDITLQAISIFSLIDCLAQESAQYPTDRTRKTFCDFVIKHQKQCNYINEVEPITLYYRVEDLIDKGVLINGFPPEKEVSIEDIGYIDAIPVKSLLMKGKSNEILDYLNNKFGKEFAESIARDHQIISLIYQMRNKAVHEMSGLGESFKKTLDILPNEPYYRDVGRLYVHEENVVSDDVVELVIPNKFLRNILVDCINGYLEDCKTNNRFPFSHNNISRLIRLSWYDKSAKQKLEEETQKTQKRKRYGNVMQ